MQLEEHLKPIRHRAGGRNTGARVLVRPRHGIQEPEYWCARDTSGAALRSRAVCADVSLCARSSCASGGARLISQGAEIIPRERVGAAVPVDERCSYRASGAE